MELASIYEKFYNEKFNINNNIDDKIQHMMNILFRYDIRITNDCFGSMMLKGKVYEYKFFSTGVQEIIEEYKKNNSYNIIEIDPRIETIGSIIRNYIKYENTLELISLICYTIKVNFLGYDYEAVCRFITADLEEVKNIIELIKQMDKVMNFEIEENKTKKLVK